jgi:serine/threonine-protein kinase
MGEVYRATDVKLGRDVAIKVLSAEFAQDTDRLARLEREARLLALLNHPNIASIYGLEKSEDLLYLVLELVEGLTLRERLSAASLSIQETLLIFHQIAQALEAAHEKGVVHRDLKPENIKITPERLVKVLDFGLAKILAAELKSDELSKSPTATYRGTSAGVVLGTIPYMSPEQIRAQSLDKRTDIWSFGCSLYEALTFRHPFYRETGSDIIAAIIGSEPDWEALPRKTPRNIYTLLRRCLQKDVRDRLHDIADARIEIGEALDKQSGIHGAEERVGRGLKRYFRYGLAALVGALVAAFAIWGSLGSTPLEKRPVRRFVMGLPPTAPLELGSGTALAISPDGSRLVYVARQGDQTQLFVRALDQLQPTLIHGTEGAAGPFFSPDGESVGFFAGGRLKKLLLPSGSPLSLADSPAPRGACWGQDGRIVFSPLTTGGLYSISNPGAVPDSLTTLSSDKGEKSHRWPEILPGDRGAIYTAWTGSRFDIEVLSRR